MTSPPPDTGPRPTLGPYRLERFVARGGMGEIWRGTDTRDGRAVAVKKLLEHAQEEESTRRRARLLRETHALQQVEHPNIVRFLDAGFDDAAQPYLVLEWLEGEDLATRLARQPLPLHQVVDVARQVLGALAVCHAQGIVHRDIKPANLFLVPDGDRLQVKLLDLGLAMLEHDATTRLTMAGAVMGTLHYLSPEQARGDLNVDHRTDLYAVGVILYQLCLGELPFCGTQPVTVLLKIVTETPPRPRQLRPDLPPWLDELIVRAMQRAASDRFDSAEEMIAVLDRPLAATAWAAPGAAAVPVEASLAETMAISVSTASLEYRMVCLLCAQPIGAGLELAAAVTEAVGQAGGTVHHLLGGQVIGIFGLDRTVGDEGLRMVQAGEAVRDRVGRQARLLAATVHVQVREGLQLDADDLDRMVERLSTQPLGELVLDRATRQLVGTRIAIRRIGTQDAVLVGSTGASSSSRASVQTPTLGRETELAGLRAAFRRAADAGEAEVALLVGPLGIGKSRLVDELLPELRQHCALCLEGRVDSSKSRMPYALWAGALLRQAGADIGVGRGEATRRGALASFLARCGLGADGDEQAFIGEALGLSLERPTPSLIAARSDRELMRERVAAAFAGLLRAAAASGPVCLCLEDLQWADEESLALCETLLDRLDGEPLFVLATARRELLARRAATFGRSALSRIELEPLGRRALRSLIKAILGGGEVSPDLEERVGEWSDGNPYFVEELLSWLSSRDALVAGEEGWQLRTDAEMLELPAGIEGAIQARLDQLDSQLKELVKGASVFGATFWEAGCEALGHPGASAALERLERAQFVIAAAESHIAGTREWVFRHPLVQQVAYRMLPREYRRTLHRQAARWLEAMGETDAAWLAYHFYEGGDARRAADYSARAGERCLADGDLDRAVEHFRAALDDRLPAQTLAARSMGLCRALILLGRYDEAWEAVSAVAADRDSELAPGARAAAWLLRGRIRYAQGQYPEAEAHLGRAAGWLGETGDPALRFETDNALFWVVWVKGRYDDAANIARRLASGALLEDRADHLCSARLAEAYCSINAADYAAAIALTAEALEQARRVGHPYREVDALTLLGSTHELVGQYEAALRSLREALELAGRLDTVYHQMSIHAAIGQIELALERVPAALEHLERAISRAERIGESRMLAISLGAKARALVRRRQPADLSLAAIVAQRALELAEQRAPPVEAEALMAMVQVSLALGDVDEAVDQARTAIALLDRLGAPENEIEILLAAHDAFDRAGQPQQAAATLQRAHRRLLERADRMASGAIRDSFLQRVPHNARVLRLASGPSAR